MVRSPIAPAPQSTDAFPGDATADSPPVDNQKTYLQRWRETQQKRESEGDKWAKLELEFGRFGLGASLACGFILVFTAYIASIMSTSAFVTGIGFYRPEMALWFPVLATSFVVAGFTVAKKLGPYRRGYTSAHFLSSIGAFTVASVFLILAVLDHARVFDLGLLVLLMYPCSALGMSLAVVSLAITWEGVGIRRGASIATALAVPVTLSLIPLAGITWDDPRMTLLYALDSMFIAFSGAMLLMIASGAETSQREIFKTSDTKVSHLKEEMESKIDALAYKEKGYVDREAHLEAKERDLLEIETELNSRTKELNSVQAKLDGQGKTLTDLESKLAKMRAEVEVKVEEYTQRDKEMRETRTQVDEARKALAEREAAASDREKEFKRAQIEVGSRQRATDAKVAELKDAETRLAREGSSVDARRDEVIRLEKELKLRESAINLKLQEIGAKQGQALNGTAKDLQGWEAKILEKEREIANREVALQSTAEELNQRQTDGDAYANALQSERQRLADREKELNAREKQVSDASGEWSAKNAEIERRWKETTETQKRAGARETEYYTLFKDAKLREADVSTTKEELARRISALEARETKLKEWQTNLASETKRLQGRQKDVISREKSLQSKESDLSLKELEVATRDRARAAASPGVVDADEQQVWELREKALREREEETKRRFYQREKELEGREVALRERLKTVKDPLDLDILEADTRIRVDRGGKLKSGTPRLDDLMYGGFPMNANVLFVGPAFVGKEVAILNFLAEGLRSNIPAVIVTTSKPPVEIAKEMAPVLPTFMEYEQLGLVRWIDASGTTPTDRLTRDGHSFRIPNAADFEGVLEAVAEAEDEFREKGSPYFRFAFLTLSSSLTQADDKSALGFVQRLANRLRQSKCIAAFALERGMHTDQQVEALQQLMDGALHFKQDKSKTLMSVVGVGEAQTRDWVPYKFTNKQLMIGSIQLERIR